MGNKWDVRMPSALRTLVVLTLVVMLAGCGIVRDTKNVGLTGWIIDGLPLVVTAPAVMYGMETATWVATWTASTSPYIIAWDFGGGAENIPAAQATSPATVNVTMDDVRVDATYSYTVTVADEQGFTQTATGMYTVGASRVPVPTMTTSVDGGLVTCTVANAHGNDVIISVTPGSGFGDPPAQTVIGGNGSVTFEFSSSDLFAGSNGTVVFTADDGYGGTAPATADLTFDPITLAADTLYAIPLASSAAVGAPVTIVVATGATGAFQFMLNVGLVVPADASYESNTFNVGAVGGNTDDADGVWSAITSNGGFILQPDALIIPGADPDGSLGTNQRFDFNITPLGGTDQASVSGELFNAQFSFSSAGTKTISFQEFNGVNRTYYTDLADMVDTFWGTSVDGTIDVS